MSKPSKIYNLYLDLLQKYSDPQKFWPQWCAKKKDARTREIIAIGAILTQRTTWHNADLALKNLKKKNLLSLKKIAGLRNLDELTELIRSAGFFQTKPHRLFELCSFIFRNYGTINNLMKENLQKIRENLLRIKGIGPETADTICLYVLDKPSFVIDEYTKRWVKKHRLSRNLNYENLKSLFEKSLPKDYRLYQDFHALIIVDQKGQEGSKMEKV